MRQGYSACWKQWNEAARGDARNTCLAAVLASVAHVVIFIRYQTAVLRRCLHWVRFNRQHMVHLDCPHSWRTDHYQYLQGGQCDLQRWESSRQRHTTQGKAEACTVGCTAESRTTRVHRANGGGGGVKWWRENCADLLLQHLPWLGCCDSVVKKELLPWCRQWPRWHWAIIQVAWENQIK